MRSEKEMYELILGTAEEDGRIRAVYMNGSRTNRNAPRDLFQDYDIVYVVNETREFYEDPEWIDRFGERLYMQMPELMDQMMGMEMDLDANFGWLMQFADGNRIDLHVQSIPYARENIIKDKLCRILLDKDGILPGMPEPTDEEHWVKRPSEQEFLYECNEFWWCLNSVAKGLWREEIPYVMDMLNFHVRPQLITLLSWKIGRETEYRRSVGKCGKYMKNFLSAEEWERFLRTYPDAKTEHIWDAVEEMCGLFDDTAREEATELGFDYNEAEAAGSRKFLKRVRSLPRDATEIF